MTYETWSSEINFFQDIHRKMLYFESSDGEAIQLDGTRTADRWVDGFRGLA